MCMWFLNLVPKGLKWSDKNGEFQENGFVVDGPYDGYIFGGVQRQCTAQGWRRKIQLGTKH